jgi:hypothetical protein
MSANEIIRAVLIHLVTPAVGFVCYIWLCVRMRKRDIPEPPYITYFFLFSVLGGWLMILLTALFWFWSGMASLGALFLTFASPFIASVFAFALAGVRADSAFHRWAFRISFVYAVAVFAFDAIWITWTSYYHT